MEGKNTFVDRTSLLEKLFCFFLVISSGTLFSTDYPYALYGLVIVFITMIITRQLRYDSSMNKVTLIIGVMMVLSILQMLIFSDAGKDILLLLKNFLLIFVVFCFAFSSPQNNICRLGVIVRILLFFSFISNVIFILYFVGGVVEFSRSPTTDSLHYHYLEQICGNALVGLEYRNGGIYYEPGMYQIFLCLALLYYLYVPKIKFKLLLILYLILTIVTTFSISGYATAGGIIATYVLWKKYKSPLIKIAVLLVVFFGFFYVSPQLKESFEVKTETNSYEVRNKDLSLGFDVFLSSPVFGYGIVNHEFAKAYGKQSESERNSSNGLMNLLISFGLVGAIIVFVCFMGMIRWLSRYFTPKIRWGFAIWFIISLNTESIYLLPLFFYILGVGAANKYDERLMRKSVLNSSVA
jgi:hypothetical protein